MTNDTPITDHRAERVLAFMVASAVGLSIICFILIIVGSGAGWDFSQSPLNVIFVLPAIGLPLGLLLVIALIVVSGIRRGREAKDAGH